tara:strand:+ start:147 stop:281 length:135 start_codon:yes stop_codon:yes gene_type:complete
MKARWNADFHLRQRRKKRNKRVAATEGRRMISGRIDIVERPAIV